MNLKVSPDHLQRPTECSPLRRSWLHVGFQEKKPIAKGMRSSKSLVFHTPVSNGWQVGNDKMDVDVDATLLLPPFADRRVPSSGPTSSHDKLSTLELPADQLAALSTLMKSRMWDLRLAAANDSSTMNAIFDDVLSALTTFLDDTDLKGKVVAPLTNGQANKIVKALSDKELEDLKNGLKKGVEENNWMDLIGHRTFNFSLYSVMPLKRTAGKLRASEYIKPSSLL
jgi:hypothetical protein